TVKIGFTESFRSSRTRGDRAHQEGAPAMDAGAPCRLRIARDRRSLRVRDEVQCCECHRIRAAEVVKGRDALGRPAGPRGGRQGHDLRPRPWIACVVTALGRVDDYAVLRALEADRKSTRLNSSHQIISSAVFCSK